MVHNCSSADDEMAVIRKSRPFEMTHADGDQSIHVCCGPEGPKLSQNALLLFSGLFVVWLVIFCDFFFSWLGLNFAFSKLGIALHCTWRKERRGGRWSAEMGVPLPWYRTVWEKINKKDEWKGHRKSYLLKLSFLC